MAKKYGLYEVQEMVEQILTAYPYARSSDDELIAILYGNYFGIRHQTFTEVVRYRKAYNLPSFETITRARRKLQEEHPEYRGRKYIEEERVRKQLEFIKYSQGGK